MSVTTTTLPNSNETEKLIQLLIKNIVEIKDTSGEFILHLPGQRSVDTKAWDDWEWTHGVGLYGILRSYELTSSPVSLKVMTDWFEARFKEGTPHKNVNTMAAFLTLAYLYELTGERSYLPYLDAWGEWAYGSLLRTKEGGFAHTTFVDPHAGQLWDDTLMMTVLPLAKIGLVLNRPQYVKEAKRQVLVHVKYLVDRTTGLFFHGWAFDAKSGSDDPASAARAPVHMKPHNFADALWARGNSWLTIFIPEFLSLLEGHWDDDDPIRVFMLSTWIEQVDALVECQNLESGLWHTLLDDPTSYLESSATAGFASGILLGLRKRYIKGEQYENCAKLAIAGIASRIDQHGELKDVSFGTPVFDDLQGYKDVPLTSMPYGQAMAMLAFGEWIRRFL